MKQSYLAFVLAIIMLLLVGCGGTSTSPSQVTAKDSDQDLEETYDFDFDEDDYESSHEGERYVELTNGFMLLLDAPLMINKTTYDECLDLLDGLYADYLDPKESDTVNETIYMADVYNDKTYLVTLDFAKNEKGVPTLTSIYYEDQDYGVGVSASDHGHKGDIEYRIPGDETVDSPEELLGCLLDIIEYYS